MSSSESEARRTKRRYAHELYPHAAEDEIRPLEVEVPYLYARAAGLTIWGTGWYDRSDEGLRRSGDRSMLLIAARERALLADALLQGMTGQDAWQWAEERAHEESGEWIYERGTHYKVPLDQIKPYPCGPEPDHHEHYGPPDSRGWRAVFRMKGRESDCVECTEPIGPEES